MNFKTTTILLAVLIVVGAIVMFTRENSPRTPKTESTEGAAIVEFPAMNVSKLSITPNGEKTIALERDGVNWKLTSPVTAPAENSQAAQLVDELLQMRSRGSIGAAEAKSSATGLDSPRFVVEISTTDGKSVKLNIGQRTASGDSVYIQRHGQAGAQIVAGNILDDLDRPVTALRRKRLFDATPATIQQVKIATSSRTVELHRSATSGWQIVAPTEMKGDAREVSDLLIALSSLSASDFVAETVDDPKRRRLDSPQVEVSFSTAPPTTMPTTVPATAPTRAPAENNWHSVKFGAFTDVSRQNVYASTTESPALVTISTASMDSLKKSPLDLRDREVVSIDPKRVTKISIALDRPATTQPTTQPASHRQIVIEKAPAPTTSATTFPTTSPATTQFATVPARKWIIASTQPTTAPSRTGERSIDAMLSMLSPLRAERFIESPPTTQSTSRATLTIETASSKLTIEFVLGENPRGEYNALAFEPPRALVDLIERSNFSSDSVPAEDSNDAANEPPLPQPR